MMEIKCLLLTLSDTQTPFEGLKIYVIINARNAFNFLLVVFSQDHNFC